MLNQSINQYSCYHWKVQFIVTSHITLPLVQLILSQAIRCKQGLHLTVHS